MPADYFHSQVHIFSLQSDSLGVDTIALGVVQYSTNPHFHGLLQTQHGGSLESELGLEPVGALPDQSLERQTAGQALGALLVSPHFPHGHCSRLETVGLLESPGGW